MSELSIVIDSNIEKVWEYIQDIESHETWMEDAVSLECVSGEKNTVGATYNCKTKAGPFTTLDVMTVIEYNPPFSMKMAHQGAVSGEGVFRLEKLSENQTKFVWSEDLIFPWYMGSFAGKAVAMKLLHSIWRRNLKTLKENVESMA